MKCSLGTILRELEPQKDKKPREILVYGVRQGRKHPWFLLGGYDLVHEMLFDYACDGRRLEEVYERIVQYDVEEMLTHKAEPVRILGGILVRHPKIKTADLYAEIFEAHRRFREDS